jgi:hypothetical protein
MKFGIQVLQTRDLQVLKEWVVRGGRRKERIEHVVEARESDGQRTWKYRNKNKNVASTFVSFVSSKMPCGPKTRPNPHIHSEEKRQQTIKSQPHEQLSICPRRRLIALA